MSDYRVIVMTSDKYLPALRPFTWLFNKYWNNEQQVLVAGFTPPDFDLPDNFEFHSIGPQGKYPFKRWSNALKDLLTSIDDEAFVLLLEDYWIKRKVDTHAIKILHSYAVQFGYVLKIDIAGDRLFAYGADLDYDTLEYLDLIKSMPGSPYHMSLMPGIWRRDNLLQVIVSDESPHDLELQGTTRVSHMQDLLVLGTAQWPYKNVLGLRGGDHTSLNVSELKPADVEEMRALGYFEPWEGDDAEEG
jgi:hypothetical protein